MRLVYGRDVEDDALWFQHTFLVIVAKAIAAKVLDLPTTDPVELLSGRDFLAAGVNGAVESDFFDWVLASKRGIDLVRRVVNHVARFRLRDVTTDVLIRAHLAAMKGNKMDFLAKHATDARVASAILGAPGFLSGLSDTEVAYVKRRVEQHTAPEIAQARDAAIKAMKEAEQGWEAAMRNIADRAGLNKVRTAHGMMLQW